MFGRLSRLGSSSSRNLSRTPSHESTPEHVSLTELNSLLEILAEIFPEHQVSRLREVLLDASHESRLHMAANALAQKSGRNGWLKPGGLGRGRGQLEEWEKFRSTSYRTTVERLLLNEFQALPKSTILTIVAENNGDYIRSRATLLDVASKSWRFNIAAFFTRKSLPPQRPPFDISKSSTGCMALDDEIYALGRPDRIEQSLQDEQVARKINEDEYTELLECECCFNDCVLEDMTTCTIGHFFCHGCLEHSVKEALYGQGASLLLLHEKGAVRCISSVADPPCEGFVVSTLLEQALRAETYERLEQRFVNDQLRNSGLHLVRCPGCTYAAFETPPCVRMRPKAIAVSALIALSSTSFVVEYHTIVLRAALYLFPLLLVYTQLHAERVISQITAAWNSITDSMACVRRRRLEVRKVFKCENSQCGISSCIDCGKEWAPFHDCRSKALDSERLYIERAMSEAVKRTCPQCRTSFVKNGGCNLLACQCGYEMCYICRADVRQIRYKHFCQHFRFIPGQPCAECDHCSLYENEDERTVIHNAAKRAAKEWAAANKKKTVDVEQHIAPLLGYNENKWLEGVVDFIVEWYQSAGST